MQRILPRRIADFQLSRYFQLSSYFDLKSQKQLERNAAAAVRAATFFLFQLICLLIHQATTILHLIAVEIFFAMAARAMAIRLAAANDDPAVMAEYKQRQNPVAPNGYGDGR